MLSETENSKNAPASEQRETRPDDRKSERSPVSRATRWTVRGVPADVREQAIKTANTCDITVGRLLTEAIGAYVRDLGGTEIPADASLQDLADVVDDVAERLMLVEEQLAEFDVTEKKNRLVERPWMRRLD